MNHVAFEKNNVVHVICIRLFVFSVNKVSELQARLKNFVVKHVNAMFDSHLQEVFIYAFGVHVRIIAAIDHAHVRVDHRDKVFVRRQEHDVRDISIYSINALN